MCGRYSITTNPQQLAERFQARLPDEAFQPRYNAAPTQRLPVLRGAVEREIALLRWGLIPHWADDPSIGNKMINARAETVAQKPAYRDAFQSRRCLVLADGFYEWAATGNGRIPHRFVLKDRAPFAMAGLWSMWHSPAGEDVASFTIITTSPNELTASVHNRMPVILAPEAEALWLNPDTHPAQLHELLLPFPAEAMESYTVSKRVNAPTNDSPDIITPVS